MLKLDLYWGILLTLGIIVGSSLVNSLYLNNPDRLFVNHCEQAIGEKLSVSSSYKRVSAFGPESRKANRQEFVATSFEAQALTFSGLSLRDYWEQVDLLQAGNPLFVMEAFFQYSASDVYGGPLGGKADCKFYSNSLGMYPSMTRQLKVLLH